MAIWRIAAVTPSYGADDLSGAGAQLTGGRWNSAGVPVVYCSENISLALLETIAHLRTGSLPLNRYLVKVDIPDDIWSARHILQPPPVGGDAQPRGLPSIQAGDAWCRAAQTALLQVPSVIVPDECNFLLNPRHPTAARIVATTLKKWLYDARFF